MIKKIKVGSEEKQSGRCHIQVPSNGGLSESQPNPHLQSVFLPSKKCKKEKEKPIHPSIHPSIIYINLFMYNIPQKYYKEKKD